MIDFTIETHIERPVADVFAYVSDPSELGTWQTNTVSAVQESEGPVGEGTRIRETHRVPAGKEVESLVEVSEYERDRTFALRVVEGTPIHARITFEAAEHGTLMHLRAYGELTGAMRLAQPFLQVVLKRQFTAYCTTLKRLLESAQAPAEARA